MTREIAEKIVKGITDKIECNTADIDDWAEFWGFTRDDYEEFLETAVKALQQEPCDDCIRREDALMALTGEYTDSPIEILPKAIKRINKLPPVNPAEKQEPCTDAISRQAAIDAIWDGVNMDIYTREVKECLEQLPSITPTEKMGQWIVHPKGIYAHLVCDKCLSNAPYDCRTNYCPYCGAKMDVPDNNVGEMGGEQE